MSTITYELNASPFVTGSVSGSIPSNIINADWTSYVTSYQFTHMSGNSYDQTNSTLSGNFTTSGAEVGSYSLTVNGSSSYFHLTNMGSWTLIPEPGTIVMVGIALAGLALFSRRQRKKRLGQNQRRF